MALHASRSTSLRSDLRSISTTANFNLITPSLCDDGHDSPWVNGQLGGVTGANTFMQKWAPIIASSLAFQKDDLLIINFDEGDYATVTVTASIIWCSLA
ncbi:hypothetical protein [Paraburkholderia metrosideri]|uniref:Uncharacterized protein n=1 Tax=Paraburkholderia metrosideri TaxID=580937 RepID=A0ABN7I079_9BURK|nr:hypothetical protein [Paraburkholderia metrosideri]CAD6538754.1 hypothetical protein LMG28140_03291 [Paraburkholderia metrosideri]